MSREEKEEVVDIIGCELCMSFFFLYFTTKQLKRNGKKICFFNNEYRGSVRFLFDFYSQFIFEHIEESYGVVPLKIFF